MNLRCLSIIAAVFIAALTATISSQTVKDIMLDKSGTYIYAQVRDADINIAAANAAAELTSKVRAYCKARGLPATVSLKVDDNIVNRIDGEVAGQHRVFLYVTTASLNSLPADKSEAKPEVKPEVARVTAAPAPKAKAEFAPTPKTEEKTVAPARAATKVEAVTESLTFEASEERNAQLPDGLIGSLIGNILKQTSAKGVLACLEKGKSAMILSRYGSGDTKFMRHCYVITVEEGYLHVYSPLSYENQRTDYATGNSSATPKGTQLFWFLKK